MAESLKRVDMFLVKGETINGRIAVRGMVMVDERGICINYKNKVFRTWDDLTSFIPVEAIVTGDENLRNRLSDAGFVVEDIRGKKVSVHATIHEELLKLLIQEAKEQETFTSKVLTDILNEHYGTDFD